MTFSYGLSCHFSPLLCSLTDSLSFHTPILLQLQGYVSMADILNMSFIPPSVARTIDLRLFVSEYCRCSVARACSGPVCSRVSPSLHSNSRKVGDECFLWRSSLHMIYSMLLSQLLVDLSHYFTMSLVIINIALTSTYFRLLFLCDVSSTAHESHC